MNYGFVITRKGLNLITKLLMPAELVFTRVMVGNGRLPENPDPANFTDLIAPIAQATSTTPKVNNHQLEFKIEYRNDLGVDLGESGPLSTGFWLNEFGIFALDPDEGEILLYYATLGDYPQWVQPFITGMLDVRRYPVSIGLNNNATVKLEYPSVAFLNADDLDEHNQYPGAHGGLRVEISDADTPEQGVKTHHFVLQHMPRYNRPSIPPVEITAKPAYLDIDGVGIVQGAIDVDGVGIKTLAIQI